MELQWEDPPEEALIRAQNRSGGHYLDIAIALRKHPGKWAKINKKFASEKSAQNTAQNMRRGQVKGFTRGEYDVLSHGSEIWVMFKGPVEEVGPNDEGTPTPPAAEDEGAASPSLAPKIREWAREHGWEVPDRGRIPQEIRDQYFANHPEDEMPPHLSAVPR